MARLLRVTLGGDMPGGERWTINPVFRFAGGVDVPVSAEEAQDLAVQVAATNPATAVIQMWTSATTYKRARVEARSLAGALESVGEQEKATALNGLGPQAHPFQTSVCVSTRTALAGASHRGRLYLPATGQSIVAGTLRISASDAAGIATSAATWFVDLQEAMATIVGPVELCVWSRKLATVTPVSSVSVGDILDVQRRRRDALVESVSSVAYPVP